MPKRQAQFLTQRREWTGKWITLRKTDEFPADLVKTPPVGLYQWRVTFHGNVVADHMGDINGWRIAGIYK